MYFQTRVANLLGVAGTDVPIQDIEALMMPHQVFSKLRVLFNQNRIYC